MIKLQDFARECGVTDRAIQKHLKKYESELVGHYERRGQNGTWLDDEACEIIRGKMKEQPTVVYEDGEVVEKIQALKSKLDEKQEKIEGLQDKIIDLQEQLQQAQLQSAQIALLEAETAAKDKELAQAQKTAQEASDELTAARQKEHTLQQQLGVLQKENEELRNRKWYHLLFGKE